MIIEISRMEKWTMKLEGAEAIVADNLVHLVKLLRLAFANYEEVVLDVSSLSSGQRNILRVELDIQNEAAIEAMISRKFAECR